jgi:hypothetical protein
LGTALLEASFCESFFQIRPAVKDGRLVFEDSKFDTQKKEATEGTKFNI